MKYCLFFFLCLAVKISVAQELFVFTEPASNMATKSIGIRANNFLRKDRITHLYYDVLEPEVMWGVSKKLMLHVAAYLGNSGPGFQANGGSLYGKYRFFSQDEVHSHFRMAAFIKLAVNKVSLQQHSIELGMQNSGYELGIVSTKLINKLALSATASFLHATDNLAGNKFLYSSLQRNAVGYSLSAGKLILPKEYISYNQTNMNMMLEVLGQTNLSSGQNFTDLAPSVQFIFLSKMRLDVGYRFPIMNSLERNYDSGFLLRFEYNFFNVYK